MADYPKRAPTSTGMYPLRPSRVARADDPLVQQGILQEGELLGYTRDPSKWLPGFTLEEKPLVKSTDLGYNKTVPGRKPTKRKTKDTMENIENTENVETTEDTRSDEQKAPRKRAARAGTPKAAKAKPEPKPAWEPNEQVTAALNAISAIDHFDKKGIAQIVKAAIELRTAAKTTRELAEEEAQPVAEAGTDDSTESAE